MKIVDGSGNPAVQGGIRRFVVISPYIEYCICLWVQRFKLWTQFFSEKKSARPIKTYSRRGVTKYGLNAADHAVVYSGPSPVYFREEKAKGLTKKPIRMIPKSPRHELTDNFRINYSEPYTVDYNVKVWFVGNIDSESMWDMMSDLNISKVNTIHSHPGSSPPLGTDEPSPPCGKREIDNVELWKDAMPALPIYHAISRQASDASLQPLVSLFSIGAPGTVSSSSSLLLILNTSHAWWVYCYMTRSSDPYSNWVLVRSLWTG